MVIFNVVDFSENGEARFRKRSSSASISIHGTLIRTFSGKDEALLEEVKKIVCLESLTLKLPREKKGDREGSV